MNSHWRHERKIPTMNIHIQRLQSRWAAVSLKFIPKYVLDSLPAHAMLFNHRFEYPINKNKNVASVVAISTCSLWPSITNLNVSFVSTNFRHRFNFTPNKWKNIINLCEKRERRVPTTIATMCYCCCSWQFCGPTVHGSVSTFQWKRK